MQSTSTASGKKTILIDHSTAVSHFFCDKLRVSADRRRDAQKGAILKYSFFTQTGYFSPAFSENF